MYEDAGRLHYVIVVPATPCLKGVKVNTAFVKAHVLKAVELEAEDVGEGAKKINNHSNSEFSEGGSGDESRDENNTRDCPSPPSACTSISTYICCLRLI